MSDCSQCKYKLMAKFKPPTIDELRAFAKQLKWDTFDAEYFFHKNSSVGWVDNRGIPYKEWKGIVMVWFLNAKKRGEIKPQEKSFKEKYNEKL